mgnify:CR=1 FL=1
MGLDLKTGDIVFLDTAPFIYFFEQHPHHFPALKRFFDRLYAADAQAITSVMTYIELTTHPARKGKANLVRKYRDFLSNSENISIFPLDMDIADHVVAIRARHQFKTPDAIQIGNAACSVGAFVALGFVADGLEDRLASLPTPPHRQVAARSERGFVVIDDTFNSNPAGASRALDLLAEQAQHEACP